jgi:hypothetical protein
VVRLLLTLLGVGSLRGAASSRHRPGNTDNPKHRGSRVCKPLGTRLRYSNLDNTSAALIYMRGIAVSRWLYQPALSDVSSEHAKIQLKQHHYVDRIS